MHIKGVLFDKDDTLIRLESFWKEPIYRLAKQTANDIGVSENEPIVDILIKEAGFFRRKLIPESLVVTGTNEDIYEAWKKICCQQGIGEYLFSSMKYKSMWLSRFADLCYEYGVVEPYEDVETVLKHLKSKKIYIGVVTSDYWNMTNHCLTRLGIRQYVDQVYTADRVRKKPYPDAAIYFADYCQLCLKEIVMVGDSENDMKFAYNAGIHGIYLDRANQGDMPVYAEAAITNLCELTNILS